MANGKILRPSRIFSDTNTLYTMARSTASLNGQSVEAHKGFSKIVTISVPSGYTLVFNASANVQGQTGCFATVDTGETSTSCNTYIVNSYATARSFGSTAVICVNSLFRKT